MTTFLGYCSEGRSIKSELHKIHTDERTYPTSTFKNAIDSWLHRWKTHLELCQPCREADIKEKAQTDIRAS